ncbi:MAG TPA: hypothetical protein VML75_14265 [Kofleriaceae bacterium]|nr:hypothetical protein [Kofleriaceae bacterium]
MQASKSLIGSLTQLWVLLALVASLLVVTGCKQGLGDVCQIDSDCEDGLICSDGEMQCVLPGGGDGDGDGD